MPFEMSEMDVLVHLIWLHFSWVDIFFPISSMTIYSVKCMLYKNMREWLYFITELISLAVLGDEAC